MRNLKLADQAVGIRGNSSYVMHLLIGRNYGNFGGPQSKWLGAVAI